MQSSRPVLVLPCTAALSLLGALAPTALWAAESAATGVTFAAAATALAADVRSGRFGQEKTFVYTGTPMTGLRGRASVDSLGAYRCRRTVHLQYDQPYERRGVRFSELERRSVQEGSCRALIPALTVQVQQEVDAIAAQVGESAPASAPAAALPTPTPTPAPVATGSTVRLVVRVPAKLRAAPSLRARVVALIGPGVERIARAVPGASGWFELLDYAGAKRGYFIHESVVARRQDKDPA